MVPHVQKPPARRYTPGTLKRPSVGSSPGDYHRSGPYERSSAFGDPWGGSGPTGCAFSWCRDFLRFLTLRWTGSSTAVQEAPVPTVSPAQPDSADGESTLAAPGPGAVDQGPAPDDNSNEPKRGRLLHSPPRYTGGEELWRKPTERLSREDLVRRRIRQRDDSPLTKQRKS